jgi:hypothetical protein
MTRSRTDHRPGPEGASPAGPEDTRRITILVVSLTSSIIAVCAFAFSFGNIWHLARVWGLPDPIAPLVAPMLDISVVGLLIAVRHLTLHGVPARPLRAARVLLLACAVTTWTLNIAYPVLHHSWGAAVMDSVAPALLLGWAEVGPTLLRLAADLPTMATARAAPPSRRPVHHRTGAGPQGVRSLPPPPGLPRLRPFDPANDDPNDPLGRNGHDPGIPDAA